MTRGQRGSLLLHCGALSSPTLRRFIPALSGCPVFSFSLQIEYVPGSSDVKLNTKRWGWLEVLVQLHTTHGFHHDFLPAGAWALLSLLGSIALLLLGGTGIYLWFVLHEERVAGSVVLVLVADEFDLVAHGLD